MPLLRSVCVFCGARNGSNPSHVDAAKAVGTLVATAGWRLIYGAGDVGLMGEVARAAMAAGTQTLGVIPTHLMAAEHGKHDLTTLVITQTMHERKKVMFMNADAIVLLPGGAGSLDEFFEVLTWAQIGLHDKPIFVLNAAGYWDPLLALLEHVVTEGFAAPTIQTLFKVAENVPTLGTLLHAALD